jgi:hypothetical protein
MTTPDRAAKDQALPRITKFVIDRWGMGVLIVPDKTSKGSEYLRVINIGCGTPVADAILTVAEQCHYQEDAEELDLTEDELGDQATDA